MINLSIPAVLRVICRPQTAFSGKANTLKTASTIFIISFVSDIFIFCLFRFFKECANHDILFMVPEFLAKKG